MNAGRPITEHLAHNCRKHFEFLRGLLGFPEHVRFEQTVGIAGCAAFFGVGVACVRSASFLLPCYRHSPTRLLSGHMWHAAPNELAFTSEITDSWSSASSRGTGGGFREAAMRHQYNDFTG